MAKDYKTIIKITDEEKNKIIDNSPKNLPLNPSAQGYSGAEIRKRLYQSTVGEDGSLLALLERLVDVLTTELNAIETDKADVSYADSGLSLKADKTYVDTELDKKVDKTVYELAINDLENNKLSVITFNSEKNTMTVYVDTKANTAKSEAQSYADTKDASVLLEAKAYTDTQDSTTLNQAKSYTDGKIDSLIANAPATYDTLKEIADYIASDQTFSQSILLEIAGLKTDKVAVSVYNSKIASIESNISNLQSGVVNVARTDANTQTFTGVNTFTQTVNLNRSGSSTTDPALTFNIGQNGSARIRVEPTTNPEQSPTTFNLQPTYLGGEEQLLHTGNVKTINTESIFGSGNITINASSVSYSNTTSGLTTTTVQGAIDELAGVFASKQEVEDAFDELATLMEGV